MRHVVFLKNRHGRYLRWVPSERILSFMKKTAAKKKGPKKFLPKVLPVDAMIEAARLYYKYK